MHSDIYERFQCNCRELLLDGIKAAHEPHARAQDNLFRLSSRTARLRDQRTQLASTVQDALNNLVSHLRPDKPVSSADFDNFERSCSKFIEDSDQLRQYEGWLRDAEDELCEAEYQVAIKQAQFVWSWQKSLEQHLDSRSSITPLVQEDVAIESPTNGESMPNVLTSFYEKIGDVTIAKERLEDLDVAHRERKRERESRQAAQRDLSVDTLDLELDYCSRRIILTEELEIAKAEARRLRAECVAQDVYPDRDHIISEDEFDTLADTNLKCSTLDSAGDHDNGCNTPQESNDHRSDDLDTSQESGSRYAEARSDLRISNEVPPGPHSIWIQTVESFWKEAQGNDMWRAQIHQVNSRPP